MADIKSFALSRSERRDDNSLISPVELLEGLAAELRSAMADPETSLPDGAVVIFLHTGPDHSEFCGHFHTPLASSRGTANGCLPGPSEYSTSFRLRPSQPMQAFIAVHPEHFITQTRWIKPGLPDEGSLYEAPVNASEVRPKYRVKAVSIP